VSVRKQETDVQQAAAKPFMKSGFLTGSDMGLAVGIIIILTVLFLPVPAVVLDIGLAFSIAFSVLILMVALWIQRRSTFPPFRRCC
jgi:flagellar biosynthesis protein FlhA